MTNGKPGESAAEILSRLLAEAQRLWGEVRADGPRVDPARNHRQRHRPWPDRNSGSAGRRLPFPGGVGPGPSSPHAPGAADAARGAGRRRDIFGQPIGRGHHRSPAHSRWRLDGALSWLSWQTTGIRNSKLKLSCDLHSYMVKLCGFHPSISSGRSEP